MTKEEWRDVPGYEGWYQVSNLGQIRRIAPGKSTFVGRILNPKTDDHGYIRITLHKKGRGKTIRIHRIIMETFHGECPSGMEVNHKNGDKTDNRLSNLEYVTLQENMHHSWNVLGRPNMAKGEGHGMSKLTDNDVREIRRLFETGQYTKVAIGKMFNVTHKAIERVVTRRNWKHVK